MNLNRLLRVSMLVVLSGLVAVRALAVRNCDRVVVRSQVEVPAGEVSLADILAPQTCFAVAQSAAGVRLGVAPLSGSARVLKGEQVRDLLARLPISTGVGAFPVSVPERVTIRRAGRRDECSGLTPARAMARPVSASGSTARLRTGGRTLACEAVARATPGDAGAQPEIVHRGDRVTLAWDGLGIRLTMPAVSLDAGILGAQVRARIEPGGRVMSAIVVGRGRLRVGS